MTRKPTPAQTEAIIYFAGGPRPTQRVTEATYRACREAGWIEKTEQFPFHSTTDAGRKVVAQLAA